MKILLIEDYKGDVELCQNAIEDINENESDLDQKIKLTTADTISKALSELDDLFDGVIVDINLGKEKTGGNKVLEKIKSKGMRIPVVVLTGTPDSVAADIPLLDKHKKGDVEYIEIVNKFKNIYNSGITKVMGGRGLIEKALTKVFHDSIIPTIKQWTKYGSVDADRSEKSLLRYTLSHLQDLLEKDDENVFPEEFYINPSQQYKLSTGSIIVENRSKDYYVVASPSCDIVVRDAKRGCNTDHIMIVKIDLLKDVYDFLDANNELSKNQLNKLEKCFKNDKQYLHWLPKVSFFKGGVLNFRKMKSVQNKLFYEKYENTSIRVAPFFMKDISARFSNYYSRQGQPDIEYKDYLCNDPTPKS